MWTRVPETILVPSVRGHGHSRFTARIMFKYMTTKETRSFKLPDKSSGSWGAWVLKNVEYIWSTFYEPLSWFVVMLAYRERNHVFTTVCSSVVNYLTVAPAPKHLLFLAQREFFTWLWAQESLWPQTWVMAAGEMRQWCFALWRHWFIPHSGTYPVIREVFCKKKTFWWLKCPHLFLLFFLQCSKRREPDRASSEIVFSLSCQHWEKKNKNINSH